MTNQVVRDNVVVHTGSVDVFEYDQQGQFRVQQDTFDVLPNDVFRTNCYYRDGTEFGKSSQDEVCIASLLYYPEKNVLGTPWVCGYGLGDTNICTQELTVVESLDNDSQLGRIFGTSTQCDREGPTGSPPIDINPPTDPPTDTPTTSPSQTPTQGCFANGLVCDSASDCCSNSCRLKLCRPNPDQTTDKDEFKIKRFGVRGDGSDRYWNRKLRGM